MGELKKLLATRTVNVSAKEKWVATGIRVTPEEVLKIN